MQLLLVVHKKLQYKFSEMVQSMYKGNPELISKIFHAKRSLLAKSKTSEMFFCCFFFLFLFFSRILLSLNVRTLIYFRTRPSGEVLHVKISGPSCSKHC